MDTIVSIKKEIDSDEDLEDTVKIENNKNVKVKIENSDEIITVKKEKEDVPLKNEGSDECDGLINEFSTVLTLKGDGSLMTIKLPRTGYVYERTVAVVIRNCVARIDVRTALDLIMINASLKIAEYSPPKHKYLIAKLPEPRASFWVFKSGKIICTGASNEYYAQVAATKLSKILQKVGYDFKTAKFEVVNIIATCDLQFPIDLELLNVMHNDYTSYNPELFPGLTYRIEKPKVTLRVFTNGKIVFVGARTRADITNALTFVYPILLSCSKVMKLK